MEYVNSTSSPRDRARLDRRPLRHPGHQIQQGQTGPESADQALVDHRAGRRSHRGRRAAVTTPRPALPAAAAQIRRRLPQPSDGRRHHQPRQRHDRSERPGTDPARHGPTPHVPAFPGSEIALGTQLKHIASRALANRSTQGYANADNSWADHLESAIDAARFRRIEDLYHAHKAGQAIGYGPGADRITQTFNDIQHAVQARGGDATVERAMLQKTRLSIRFGTLNHCVMDENNPAGAACLDDAVIPRGHKGPLQDRCRPDRCVNSVIGPEHLPIWATERQTLLTLIDTPSLPASRKAMLQRELDDVETVLSKAIKEQQ
jgi:hypothetical protein